MPRSKFLGQLEGSNDIQATGQPSENTFLPCQAPRHLAGFLFVNAACLVIEGGIQERWSEPDANALDMMVSSLAGGDKRRTCRFQRDNPHMAVGLAQDSGHSHEHSRCAH